MTRLLLSFVLLLLLAAARGLPADSKPPNGGKAGGISTVADEPSARVKRWGFPPMFGGFSLPFGGPLYGGGWRRRRRHRHRRPVVHQTVIINNNYG
ncbi:hypothetical protein M3Y99_00642900 [Aphelenchoides fujianensis]|nr:hypothetical protein M3Y99_00642900 [Aphelenchoides fujianensis]